MSSIDPKVELLLNASIDDALTPDEQEQLTELLKHDAQARGELRELTALRSTVRAATGPLLTQAMTKPLGQPFAERIVSQAIAAAEQAGVAPDHPLRLAAADDDQPKILSIDPAANRRRATAAALIAACLAAATVAGIALGLRDDRQSPTVAENSANSESTPATEPPAATEPAPATESGSTVGPPTIADSNSAAADERPNRVTPQPNIDARPNSVTPSALAEAAVAEFDSAAEMRRSASDAAVAQQPPVGPADEAAAPALRALLVVSVELSDRAGGQQALQDVFDTAGIVVAGDNTIADHTVRGLVEEGLVSDGQPDDAVNLYYVQSPAHQIDRLLSELIRDRASFGPVGFSIASSPAVLAAAGNWRPGVDEQSARQTPRAVATGLVAAPGQRLTLDSGSAILPLGDDTSMARSLFLPPENGNPNDFISQFLLIVH